MIYYTIKDKKKNEKIEYAYKYTCEDEKTWEAYKKETTITPSASYSYALTYGDTEYDVEFFDGLYSWVSQAKVKSYRSSEGDVYTQIVFSDGTTRYRYDGFERWGTITPRTVTINDALQIYERNSVIWNDGEGLWSMHTEMWADTLNGAYSRSPEGATHALSLILGAEKAIISSAISEVITIFVGGKEITIKLIQEYSPL